MKTKLRVNPWTSMWIKPRETIRELIEYNVNYRMLTICGLYGFFYTLYILLQTPYLKKLIELKHFGSIAGIVIGSLIISIPIGYILFNLTSIFLFLGGKIIKAKGTFKQIRASLYWSHLPFIVSLILSTALIIIFSKEVEVVNQAKLIPKTGTSLMLAFGLIGTFFGIWGFIITLKALGEVHRFSAWMALLNYFFAFLIATVISLLFYVAMFIFI